MTSVTMTTLGRDDDKNDGSSPDGAAMALGNLRATVKMAPIVRVKRPVDDEVPTAPQTQRGGSNIHDEITKKQTARGAGDATTQRRPTHPPDASVDDDGAPDEAAAEDDGGATRSPSPEEQEPPESIPRWDDDSFPLAAARELARDLEIPAETTRRDDEAADAAEEENEVWDDVTVPRPRPQASLPVPRAPRRVSTAAPHSADFPSLDKPDVVVSPVLTIDDPPPEPAWIERAPPPTTPSPTPKPPRVMPLLVAGLLVMALAAVGLAFLL